MQGMLVRASDGTGITDQIFIINVENIVNDAPSDILLSTQLIETPVQSYGLVTYLSSDDIDGPASTFSLVSGSGDTDNDLFIIMVAVYMLKKR